MKKKSLPTRETQMTDEEMNYNQYMNIVKNVGKAYAERLRRIWHHTLKGFGGNPTHSLVEQIGTALENGQFESAFDMMEANHLDGIDRCYERLMHDISEDIVNIENEESKMNFSVARCFRDDLKKL